MAAVLNVTCPNCGKALKVPAELEGKRVKCKGCDKPFPVAAPKPAAKAPPPAEASGARPEPPAAASPDRYKVTWDDEADNDGSAVGVIKEEDVPRCPHCAKELNPPDAVVCVNCGFNSRTRSKAETRKVYEPTGAEWASHLFPGVAAVTAVVVLMVLDVVCAFNMRSWMEGGMLEDDAVGLDGKKKMYVSPGAFIMFVLFGSIVAIAPLARIGFKRLFVNYLPEEKKMADND